MSEASETIADIVAEMRELAADIETGNAVVGQTVWRNYADRIEAAAKREKADALSAGGLVEAMRHKPSNAAAMREALANLVDVIDRCDSGSPLWWHCGAKGVMPLKNAKAALAAPPRNCDLPYNDSVEMYGTFKDWCKAKGHTMEPMLACDAFDWLLSPATEQKGETDGSK